MATSRMWTAGRRVSEPSAIPSLFRFRTILSCWGEAQWGSEGTRPWRGSGIGLACIEALCGFSTELANNSAQNVIGVAGYIPNFAVAEVFKTTLLPGRPASTLPSYRTLTAQRRVDYSSLNLETSPTFISVGERNQRLADAYIAVEQSRTGMVHVSANSISFRLSFVCAHSLGKLLWFKPCTEQRQCRCDFSSSGLVQFTSWKGTSIRIGVVAINEVPLPAIIPGAVAPPIRNALVEDLRHRAVAIVRARPATQDCLGLGVVELNVCASSAVEAGAHFIAQLLCAGSVVLPNEVATAVCRNGEPGQGGKGNRRVNEVD
ncbi:hypothetical protein B0H12DRAFT_1077360 [Mycena haematopus]|nr:hypothetical protein B0H12DRAFT_1077360 [Mycena haematopus]